MKFVKNNIYTAVNADKLKKGDKVIVANDFKSLKARFEKNLIQEIDTICSEEYVCRFSVTDGFACSLAYLIERAGEKPKEKLQPKYRPFKNIKEFFETWQELYGKEIPRLPFIPDIWVIINACPETFIKINGIDFSKKSNINCLRVGDCWTNFDTLCQNYSFYKEGRLIPCGALIEE